jgi:hypothetical protein
MRALASTRSTSISCRTTCTCTLAIIWLVTSRRTAICTVIWTRLFIPGTTTTDKTKGPSWLPINIDETLGRLCTRDYHHGHAFTEPHQSCDFTSAGYHLPIDAPGKRNAVSGCGFAARGRLCSRPFSSTTVEHVKQHSLHATRGSQMLHLVRTWA